MLINASRLLDYPILSLHLGGEFARVSELIVDPNDLKLIALRIDGPTVEVEETGNILPIDRVREFSPVGMVINSADDLASDDDVVRIQKILKLRFNLIDLRVVTKSKARLGRVSDYVINTAAWEVYQLIVQRPIIKSLLDPELTINRSQIIEVDDYRVVVKEEYSKPPLTASAPKDFIPNFINPFREPDFSADIHRKD